MYINDSIIYKSQILYYFVMRYMHPLEIAILVNTFNM